MRFLITLFVILIFSCIELPAQEATIREQKVKMKTYMYADLDPVPDMSRNYPYYRFDGFTNKAVEKIGIWLLWRTNTLNFSPGSPSTRLQDQAV